MEWGSESWCCSCITPLQRPANHKVSPQTFENHMVGSGTLTCTPENYMLALGTLCTPGNHTDEQLRRHLMRCRLAIQKWLRASAGRDNWKQFTKTVSHFLQLHNFLLATTLIQSTADWTVTVTVPYAFDQFMICRWQRDMNQRQLYRGFEKLLLSLFAAKAFPNKCSSALWWILAMQWGTLYLERDSITSKVCIIVYACPL